MQEQQHLSLFSTLSLSETILKAASATVLRRKKSKLGQHTDRTAVLLRPVRPELRPLPLRSSSLSSPPSTPGDDAHADGSLGDTPPPRLLLSYVWFGRPPLRYVEAPPTGSMGQGHRGSLGEGVGAILSQVGRNS